MTDHKRFTIGPSSQGWAIFHQSPPVTHEDGSRSLSMCFPALIASEMIDVPELILGQIADLLNQHWDAE